MTAPIIILIIIGLVFIFASYFISEAMGDSVTEPVSVSEVNLTLSEEQKKIVHEQVENEIADYCNMIITETNNTLSTMSNEKTMALGDYAVSVCEEIEKNHKEEMFLYSMLGEKEKELKTLVEQIETLKEELSEERAIAKATIEYAAAEKRAKEEEKGQGTKKEAPPKVNATEDPEEDLTESALKELEDLDMNLDELVEEPADLSGDNANDLIIEMKKSGMSEVEIAKQLGMGVGEVKLVLELFK